MSVRSTKGNQSGAAQHLQHLPPIPLPAPHKEWLRKIYDARVSSGCATVAVNCPYASRAFVIPKKAPGQYREVIDYRALNSNTIKDKFPLPRIDSLFDETLNSSIKSILDMVDGYYNYRMHPESAPYTAVIAPFGQYINHVMPQGLCNAPPFFQMANTARFSELIHTRMRSRQRRASWRVCAHGRRRQRSGPPRRRRRSRRYRGRSTSTACG